MNVNQLHKWVRLEERRERAAEANADVEQPSSAFAAVVTVDEAPSMTPRAQCANHRRELLFRLRASGLPGPASSGASMFVLIIACLVALDLVEMLSRPRTQCTNRDGEGLSERRQGIFDLRRHRRVDRAAHHAVALECLQGTRKHLLRDPADGPFDLVEAAWPINQYPDNHDRPFVANDGEHLANLMALSTDAR